MCLPIAITFAADVAVMFHGGAFSKGEDFDVPKAEVDYLNEQGFVVVSLQYRLAPQ